MSYFTLKNGMKLYYEMSGSGSTVVMMHGWSANHEIYSEPAAILSKSARCIIYDHRGHGGSKAANAEAPTMETLADDLQELIEGLGLSDITLVGWSMGACAAMNYVRKYGCSALRQVVLCDMSPRLLNDEEWKMGLYQGHYTKEDMEHDETMSPTRQYRKFLLGTIPKLQKLPGLLLWLVLRKQLRKCDIPVLSSLGHSMQSQDNRDVIAQINVPLTYFYADPGSLFLPDLAEWYSTQASVPVKTVRFAESTHMLIAEHPEQFAAELEKLL